MNKHIQHYQPYGVECLLHTSKLAVVFGIDVYVLLG